MTASLRKAHAAGIVHRDIRVANVLYFDCFKSYQLIDFGMAARVGHPPELLKQTTQTEAAGARVRGLVAAKQPVDWTPIDDHEMLQRMLASLFPMIDCDL